MEKGTNPDWEQAFNRFEGVLASGNEALRLEAITKLAHFTKRAPLSVLIRTVPILSKILEVGSSDYTRLVQEASFNCLYRIACRDEVELEKEIGKSSVIPLLFRLLPNSENSFRRVLIKCLWSFVTFGDQNRVIIARNGGLELIISLLNSSYDDNRVLLLEILSGLVLLREVRRFLASSNGLRFLVEAASFGSLISRERACQAIGLLAVTRRARHLLVELGAIPVLVELFRVGDFRTKLVAGNSLGVISAHVDYIRPVGEAGAIPLYAELLQGPEHIGMEIAEDAFCILAVAEANAVLICQHLVRILREGGDESKAAAADVLWGISGYKHSVPVVRISGAIPILVDLLTDEDDEVREKVSGAVAQLSYDDENRAELADSGAIPILIEMLEDESEELRDNAAEALICFAEDPLLVDRVSEAMEVPSFQNMQNRLIHIRSSEEHMVRSMRRMIIEHLTWNPDLV
ncbi:hypothetical protein UlMin_003795 [Ulmus minor]